MPFPRLSPPKTRALLAAAALVLVALVDAAPACAQNPISSKIVGSDVARRNRRLLSQFRRPEKGDSLRKVASDTTGRAAVRRGVMKALPAIGDGDVNILVNRVLSRLPIMAERRLMASEVTEYLKLTNPGDTLRLGNPARWSRDSTRCVGESIGARVNPVRDVDTLTTVYMLEVLCGSAELRAVVPNALRLTLGKVSRDPTIRDFVRAALASDSLSTRDLVVELIASGALERVLRAVEKGHTNPQRVYLGGQIGLRLVGDDGDNGIAARASVRAAYFIPISPLAKYQLPVVTNLGDISAAPKDSQEAKLEKLTTASEGAFLSLEPTLDPWTPGPLKDVRIQFFGALGGQLNTLRSKGGTKDSTKDVQFAQGRLGAGANFELGIPSPGRPNLFISSRVVWRLYSPSSSQQVFGTRNRGTPLVETFALIPIGAGMSVLGEVSATRNSKPVVRIALWSQASPQSAVR